MIAWKLSEIVQKFERIFKMKKSLSFIPETLHTVWRTVNIAVSLSLIIALFAILALTAVLGILGGAVAFVLILLLNFVLGVPGKLFHSWASSWNPEFNAKTASTVLKEYAETAKNNREFSKDITDALEK